MKAITGRASAFYGKIWLLYHYLTFSPERTGQFYTYMKLLKAGKSSIEAGEMAFGDLDLLEKEIKRYIGQDTPTLEVPSAGLKPSPVTVRNLSDGEAAMMPLRLRIKSAEKPEQTAAFLPQMQEIAARSHGEARVLAWLAEAEFRAGNDDAAIKAADAALAINPQQVEAHLNKGFALFRKAKSAPDQAAAYQDARRPFLALNAVENNHPLPLIHFYRSFTEQGIAPTENAIKALERAAALAPFDLSLQLMLATQKINDKRYEEAATHLAPLSVLPHGGEIAELAQGLIARMSDRDTLNETDLVAMMKELTAKTTDDASGDAKKDEAE